MATAMNPYSTLVDFILLHASPEAVHRFKVSEKMHVVAKIPIVGQLIETK